MTARRGQIPSGRLVGRSAPELNLFLRQRRSLLWDSCEGGPPVPAKGGRKTPAPPQELPRSREVEEEQECPRWDPCKLQLQVRANLKAPLPPSILLATPLQAPTTSHARAVRKSR